MFPNNNAPSEKEGITISKRQASILVALFLFLALSVFIIGYFLGKKSSLDSLADTFEQQIEKTDRAQAHFEDLEDAPQISPVDQDFAFDDSQAQSNDVSSEIAKPAPVALVAKTNVEQVQGHAAPKIEEDVVAAPAKVYAQLISFHSKQSAAAFQKRLAQKNIDVVLKTRSSRSTKGRVRHWYQAVTPVFNSFPELEKTVKKIQKLEFIKTKDINIVHIKEQEDQV